MPLSFIPTSITIKAKLEDQVGEIAVKAVVAEQTGLAYIIGPSSQGEDAHITLTHMATQTSIGSGWGTSLEQEAKEWISLLHEIIDWTQYVPCIRQGKLARVLNLAAIGALHVVESEETQ